MSSRLIIDQPFWRHVLQTVVLDVLFDAVLDTDVQHEATVD